MESQSDEVVEIKRDDDECNHRIVQLFCHRNCSQCAQICEFKCKNSLSHDYTKLAHERASIDEFKIAFLNLEQTSTRQTEHYIRQLNDIERHTIQNIAKKKAECLKDIKQFKNDLMRQTYTDLQSKFPHLYEKFKNQRFDTLNCNEVFWVMHTNKHNHSLKPSLINSKLVAILRKFQTFKDVSKNISPNFSGLFVNKQKAKNFKIIQKGQQPITVVKVRQAPNLAKPDYSQDKLKQIGFLQRKKKELEDTIKNLNGKYTELSNEISHKIYMKREKQNRMRIYSQIYQLKFQNINGSNVNPINAHQEQQSSSSQLSPQLQTQHQNITQKSQVNQDQSPSNKLLRAIKAHFEQSNQQSNKNDKQINKKQQMNSINQTENRREQKRQKDKNSDEDKNENEENRKEVDKAIDEANIGISKDGQTINNNVTNIEQQKKVVREQQQQEIVKQQFVDQSIQQWMNKQLLEEMRKYGKSTSQGLKVENIDVLKSFSTVKLKSPRIKINPIIKRSIHRDFGPRKPSNFNLYAMELFDSELKRKAQGSDKKP